MVSWYNRGMKIHKEVVSGTTSTGSYSDNTNSQIRGMLRQVIVKPATITTQYDISIVNEDDLTIYERLAETGELAEQTDLPIRGTHTVYIDGATRDELFTAQLWIEE